MTALATRDQPTLPPDVAVFHNAPARPARVFAGLPASTGEMQFGDLLLERDDAAPANATFVGLTGFGECLIEQHALWASDAETRLSVIPLAVSDRFADALAHYCDAIDQGNAIVESYLQEAAVNNVDPINGDDKLHLIGLRVRPSDVGFRSAFAASETEWLLCSQWISVTVVRHADRWWINDVDFGNGIERPLRHFSAFLYRDPRLISYADPEFDPNDVARTRNLPRLVRGYRATLATAELVFVLLHLSASPAGAEGDAFDSLAASLAAFQLRPLVNWLDGDTEDSGRFGSPPRGDFTLVAIPIAGPRASIDPEMLVALASGLDTFGSLGGPRLCKVVRAGSEPRTHARLAKRYHRLAGDRDFHFPVYNRRTLGGAMALPQHQWRGVHQFITDRVLVLAEYGLRSYEMLWLLEWLPEMRHHEHIRALRLIDGLLASVRRVVERRVQ